MAVYRNFYAYIIIHSLHSHVGSECIQRAPISLWPPAIQSKTRSWAPVAMPNPPPPHPVHVADGCGCGIPQWISSSPLHLLAKSLETHPGRLQKRSGTSKWINMDMWHGLNIQTSKAKVWLGRASLMHSNNGVCAIWKCPYARPTWANQTNGHGSSCHFPGLSSRDPTELWA